MMSFSSDPWELLGLDRNLSGEREVKRAYARLLKLHRPDQDPQGFQRVSEAYQQALRDIQGDAEKAPPSGDQAEAVLPLEPDAADNRQADSTADPGMSADSPEPEAEAAPAPRRLEDFPNLPEKFLSGCEQLRQRLQRAAQSPEVPEFTMLRNMVRENPAALAAPWVVVLDALFSTERGLRLLPQMHAQDVLLLMQHGEGGCAARILMTWREEIALLNRLTQVGNLMLQQGLGNDPAMLRAIHFTAQMAAFHLPDISSRLADELYRQTGPGVREQIVREIEIRSAAGKVFSRFSLPHRRIWEHQLFESGGDDGTETDWSTPEKMSALQSVMISCDQNWEGWPLVTRVVPEAVLDHTLRQVRQAQTTVRPPPAKKSWLSLGRWAFVALWALAHILSAVFKNDSPPSYRSRESSIPPVPASLRSSSNSQTARQKELDLMQQKLLRLRGSNPGSVADLPETTAEGRASGPFLNSPIPSSADTPLQAPSSDSWRLKFNTSTTSPSGSSPPGGKEINLMDSFGK